VETEQVQKTTETQKVQTLEEKNLRTEADSLAQSQIENEKKAQELAVKGAEIKQLEAQEIATRTQAKETAVTEILAKADTDISGAIAEREAQYEAFKKIEFKDYWADKSTGNKILAAIAISLGGVGQALTGAKNNAALDVVQNAINLDFETQTAAASKQQELTQISEKRVGFATDNRKNLLLDLELKQAAAMDAAAGKFGAMLAAQGVPQAQIQSNATILGLQAKATEKKIEVQEGLRKNIQTETQKKIETLQFDSQGRPIGKEKPLTESQGNALTFGKRMEAGIKNYDKAGGLSIEGAEKIRQAVRENQVFDKVAGVFLVGAGSLIPPNLSERDRLAAQAIQEVITAGLRKDSGAAIGVNEFQNEFNQFTPKRGDSPKVIAQSRATMDTRLAAIQEQMGTGKNRFDPPAQNSQVDPNTKTLPNGETFVKTAAGWIKK
jgi:hypothetical protein